MSQAKKTYIEKNTFKQLIDKGYNLKQIGLNFKLSPQVASNLFKKYYSITYREYKKRLNYEKRLKELKAYEDQDVQKAVSILKKMNDSFVYILEKIYRICLEKNLKIKVKLHKNAIKEIYVLNKKIYIREYFLMGKTPEEKRGFYRIRPPKSKESDNLIIILKTIDSQNYFVIPRKALSSKKSVNLPLKSNQKSKYLAFKNNWKQIYL